MRKTSPYGTLKNYDIELRRIIKCVSYLRSLKSGKTTTWKKAAEWHIKYSFLHGKPALALTITLSPTGCEWAIKGGCTMCGEFEARQRHGALKRDPQFHISQFVCAMANKEVWETAQRENEDIEWLRINQEGNFINDKEMNLFAQEKILRLATKIKGLKRITIEARPQFITDKTISFLKSIFVDNDVELEIGMGIEAQDDIVRNVCINKAGTKDHFINAAKRLNDSGIFPLAYVLLKPPFLTEAEAIDEAVATSHWASDIGFKRISLEPMSIHGYTLVDALHQKGFYKVPWFWSVIEVAKRCQEICDFGIGGIGYYPIPQKYSHNNCKSDCNESVLDAIIKYNKNRDICVFDALDCDCKRFWEQELLIAPKSLKDRINEQLSAVEKVIQSYALKNDDDNENELERTNRVILAGDAQ